MCQVRLSKVEMNIEMNKTLYSDVLPSFPHVLAVSSDGPAGTLRSDYMGIYIKNGSHNYRPVYILDRGGAIFHYSHFGKWVIGPTIGGDFIGIASLLQGLVAPPSIGWQYFDSNNGEFKNDSQLTVSGETTMRW